MRLAKDYGARYKKLKVEEKVKSTVRLRRKKEKPVVSPLFISPPSVYVDQPLSVLIASIYKNHKIRLEPAQAMDNAIKFINSFGWSILINQLKSEEIQVLLNRVKPDGNVDTLEKVSKSLVVAVFSALDEVMNRSFKV
jgi:hypothetical protein